jgi:hypothetical protein
MCAALPPRFRSQTGSPWVYGEPFPYSPIVVEQAVMPRGVPVI